MKADAKANANKQKENKHDGADLKDFKHNPKLNYNSSPGFFITPSVIRIGCHWNGGLAHKKKSMLKGSKA